MARVRCCAYHQRNTSSWPNAWRMLPPVPEEEFFSFSTRFEALEVATEALQAKLIDSGYEGTVFGLEDYELGARTLDS